MKNTWVKKELTFMNVLNTLCEERDKAQQAYEEAYRNNEDLDATGILLGKYLGLEKAVETFLKDFA